MALSTNGATATASSSYSSSYPASALINGDRKGLNWGSGGGWNDSTFNTFPDWVEVDFNGSKTIDEVDVVTVQDNLGSPIEPTLTTTFSSYGTTGYDVQYWDGSAWTTVSGGSITSNNKVWRQVSFTAVTTTKIRVSISATADGASRLAEIEAWGVAAGTSSSAASINYLVTDQLGTPRMIFDQSGSLASTKRHDYAPFGEELFNGAREIKNNSCCAALRVLCFPVLFLFMLGPAPEATLLNGRFLIVPQVLLHEN
ncbi:MAG TPA: discoidin domain-containing protein [Pyrinomonadaceae bacterium]|nr:discoidin domain-containing protein [Pyrinomonadaceae bacterium]